MIGLRYRVGRLFGQAREFIRGSSCEVWDWKEQVIIVIVQIFVLLIVSIVNMVISVIVVLIVITILISFDRNKHNSAAEDFHP